MTMHKEEISGDGWVMPDNAHRDLTAFVSYWQSKRDELGAVPTIADIQPGEIPELMPGIVIIERDESGRAFKYIYVGANHYNANGCDLTGKSVDDIYDHQIAGEAKDNWLQVLEAGHAHFWSGANPLPNREITSCERVLLPLRNKAGKLNLLIGMWVWQ